MVDIGALLADAKPPQTHVSLCLDGELAAAYADAVEAVEKARKAAGEADSLAGGSAVREAQAEVDRLREQMAPAVVRFTLCAVGRKRWTELVADCPPRKEQTQDVMRGWNVDVMADKLIREGLVDPELSSEQLDLLLDHKLSEGQYNELANSAFFVNRTSVNVPF